MTETQSDISCKKTDDYLILAIDIGNSRIKMLAHNADDYIAIEYGDDWEKVFLAAFDCAIDNIPTHKLIVFISSVNGPRQSTLEEVFKNRHITFINVKGLLKTQRKIDFTSVNGIGQDRMLGLFGAIENAVPPLLTVDFGTCITINVLDENYRCLGGAILPGLKTQINSLVNSTTALKETELKSETEWIGSDTAQAIRIGVVKGACGAVNEIIRNIIKSNFSQCDVQVFFTGGFARLISGVPFDWNFDFQVVESLNLKGILYLPKIE